MKNLYEFNVDCGRMGSLQGRFLATPEEAVAIVGKHVYFGEVLGKHSEVNGEIAEKEIRLITDNREFLDKAVELGISLESGYSPLDYYTCRECGNIKDVVKDECEECRLALEECEASE